MKLTDVFLYSPVMSSIDDVLNELVDQHQKKQQILNNQQSLSQCKNNMNVQDDNIDNYLSQLTEQKTDHSSATTDNFLQEIQSIHQGKKTPSKDSQKDLFSDIENQFNQTKISNKHSDLDSSLLDNSIRQVLTHNERRIKSQQKNHTDNLVVDSSIDNIVRHTKDKFTSQQEDKTVSNLENIRQEESKKQKEIKLFERKAEQWLKSLDPNSEEGFWFEEFALSYESKKEAAIVYLKALS